MSEQVVMSDKQFKELITALKHNPASTTLDAPTLHGPFPESTTQFGIFSRPGVRPQRYSALSRPWSMANIVGISASVLQQEILEIMTGVTAAAGTNATGWCGNPPVGGQAKTCQQIFRFGKYFMKTHLNALPELGQLRNRADVPAQILNAGPTGNPFIPDLMYRLQDPQSQLQYEMWLIGVQLERTLDVVMFTGNNTLASTATELGWTAEFDGIERLVKTGYTDAVTGIACPAMDSVVETYSANVNTTTADGRNIVQVLEDVMYGLQDRAMKNSMSPQWVICMRQELFKAFVDNYVCNYNQFRCSGTTTEPLNNDAASLNQFRREMFNGLYIDVMGIRYPVVLTEGIPQTTPAANTMESDMFILPVSDAGSPLLRVEYFPMDNQYVQEFAQFAGTDVATMNNGMWIASSRDNGFCKEYLFGSKFRMILETPWLAARIDNLQYTFQAPIRNATPGASFYADGGVSIVTLPGIAG